MTSKLSGPMIQPATGAAKRLVVLLHGYGADGSDLIALASYWQGLLPDAMFIAPNAPSHCDINPVGYQWFPLDLDRDMSRLVGADMARPVIRGFLEDLWAQTGIAAKDTLLVGFSQGAMMVLDVGLRLEEEVMGIISFSGALIAPDKLEAELKSRPEVCLVHGDMDDVVPVQMSIAAEKTLAALGVTVGLHISRGAGHTIAQDGLEVASAFIAHLRA